MKKIAIVMTALAVLVGNAAHAQNNNANNNNNKVRNPNPPTRTVGAGAQTARSGIVDDFAWGIGIGALAVIGVVVGVTVATAVKEPSTFSH